MYKLYENDEDADFTFIVIWYMIGFFCEKANKLKDALKYYMKVIESNSLYKFVKEHNPYMEWKIRSLFGIGRIHFNKKDYKTAEISLNEFVETVTTFPDRYNMKEDVVDEWWDIIGDIECQVDDARTMLSKISEHIDLQCDQKPSEDISKIVMTFKTSRLAFDPFDQFCDDQDLKVKVKNLDDSVQQKSDEIDKNHLDWKIMYLRKGIQYEKTGKYQEAIEEFNHLYDVLNMERFYELKNEKQTFSDEYLQLEWGHKMFFETVFPFYSCLEELNMFEEISDLFVNVALRMKEVPAKEKLLIRIIMEVRAVNFFKMGDYVNAIHYIDEAIRYCGERENSVLYIQKITSRLRLCNYIKNPVKWELEIENVKNEFMKDLQKMEETSLYTHYIGIATCEFNQGDYEFAALSIDGPLEHDFEEGATDAGRYKIIQPVYRTLCALKLNDHEYLQKNLKLTSKLCDLLSAFRHFDIFSDAFLYLNLHSKYLKNASDFKEDKRVKTKSRLFKNSFLVISKARTSFVPESLTKYN